MTLTHETRTRARNPVFHHLTRHRSWPSVLITLLIAAALSLSWMAFNMALSTGWLTLPRGYPPLQLLQTQFWSSILIFVISPFMFLIVTTRMVAATTHDEQFVLLRLTGLSPREIVTGYLRASMFQARMLWALFYAMLPPLFYSTRAALIIHMSRNIHTQVSISEFMIDVQRVAEQLAPRYVLVGAVLGTSLNWLAVCLGIWMGLRAVDEAKAVGSVLGLVLLFNFILIPLFLLFPSDMPVVSDIGSTLMLMLVGGAVAYVIGSAFIKQAEKQL